MDDPDLILDPVSCFGSSSWKVRLGQGMSYLSYLHHALWVGENSSTNLQHLFYLFGGDEKAFFNTFFFIFSFLFHFNLVFIHLFRKERF